MRTCETCKWWARRSGNSGDLGGGTCRRYPPFMPCQFRVWRVAGHPSNHVFDVTTEGDVLNDAWPYTGQQSWCGEHAQKDQP
jgi:alpha-tubulin suppressor-like RCC1 family protein